MELATASDIASRAGVPVHRVLYLIRVDRISPTTWAGNARLFDEEAVQRITERLSAVEQMRRLAERRGA